MQLMNNLQVLLSYVADNKSRNAMSAIGNAGIGGDPAQFEKAMILGDDFILSMVVDPTMSMPFLSRFITSPFNHRSNLLNSQHDL